MSFAGFDEFWLSMCAGVPEWGAIGATSVMTHWLTTDALNAATLQSLAASKYTRSFTHTILGVDEKALYRWHQGAGWSKSTVELPSAEGAPDFWDYKNDPDLLKNPEGWRDREIKRVLAELRQAGDAKMSDLVSLSATSRLPALVAAAGESASMRFLEFFEVNIRNPHRRPAYARAAGEFLAWCSNAGVPCSRCTLPFGSKATLATSPRRASSNGWPRSVTCSTGASPARSCRQRTLGRLVDGYVVPRPLSGSDCGPGNVALRLAHQRPGRGRNHPVTLYLVVPPSDISRTKPLVRLILNRGRGDSECLPAAQEQLTGAAFAVQR
jgi:hypothetical protein